MLCDLISWHSLLGAFLLFIVTTFPMFDTAVLGADPFPNSQSQQQVRL